VDSQQLFEIFPSAPPRGIGLIALCTDVHKTLSATPLSSSPSIRRRMRVLSEPRAGRVEGSLRKSDATSHFVSITCKRVRNSLKTRNFKSLSFHTHAHSFAVSPLFATHTLNTLGVYVPPAIPGSTRQSNSFAVFHFRAISHCEDKVRPTPLFSIKSALFAHSSPASPLFASLTQNNGCICGGTFRVIGAKRFSPDGNGQYEEGFFDCAPTCPRSAARRRQSVGRSLPPSPRLRRASRMTKAKRRRAAALHRGASGELPSTALRTSRPYKFKAASSDGVAL
jgi:hypothetical protein